MAAEGEGSRGFPRGGPLLYSSVLFAGGLSAVLLVGSLTRQNRTFEPAADQRPPQATVALDSTIDPDARVAEPIPGPETGDRSTPPPSSARDFLCQYYGERWKELEARIEKAGVDLDVPYQFHPWEEAAPKFQALMSANDDQESGRRQAILQWPEVLTDEWLHRHVVLGQRFTTAEEDLAAIEALLTDLNASLALLAEDYARRLDGIVHQRWNTGNYLKAPFTTMGLSEEKGFFSISHGGWGWGVTITLKREDYPDMVAIEEEASLLQEQRELRIRDYLIRHCVQ